MASAGEIIAILGLFERVVIELRNYHDAPAHFQNLSAELDLLRSALRHALQLRPQNDEERQTLDKVGAIAMHCLQPLQALADKMRTKEGSLGHFRSSKSLANIGTRVHWSLIARKDVDELRRVVLAQVAAINVLLSVQQLNQIKRLSTEANQANTTQTALINQHSTALLQQTSSILNIVTGTPAAIADLRAAVGEQTAESRALRTGLDDVSQHMEALSLTARSTWTGTRRQVVAMGRMVKRMGALMKDVQELFVFLATCSKEMLAEIGRNTRLLLRIASQLKRVIQVIEAMPRDLGVDIIRLDDAWGETWGLPLQACGSWESFCDLLQRVVFAGKPGLDQVTDDQFAITLANAGRMNLNPFTWRLVLEKNIHIEQTMVVCRAYSKPSKACPFPGCSGMTILAVNGGKRCSTCGRQATIWRRAQSIINLEYAFPEFRRPPPIQLVDGEYQHFRRVQFQEPAEPIQSTGEVIRKMKENILDASTIAYNGGLVSQHVENDCLPSDETAAALKRVAIWLLAAVLLKCSVVDDRFLAEAYMRQGGGHEAGGAMNPAAHLALSVSICFNISGVTASRLGRDADALAAFSEALRLDPSQYLSWYNLAVLVDAYDETGLAIRCFEACLQRNPDLPQVEARLQVLRRHTAGTGPPPDDFKIHDLEDYELDILKGLDSELRDE